jgi:hypothetical protein
LCSAPCYCAACHAYATACRNTADNIRPCLLSQ